MSRSMLCADPPAAGVVSGFWIASYLGLDRPGQAGAMRSRRTIIAGLAAALAITAVPAAQATVRDRDGNEDADGDGVRNQEERYRTDDRDRGSDDRHEEHNGSDDDHDDD